eukprot:4513882-Pleurochrysis_carterae.AAC.1
MKSATWTNQRVLRTAANLSAGSAGLALGGRAADGADGAVDGVGEVNATGEHERDGCGRRQSSRRRTI